MSMILDALRRSREESQSSTAGAPSVDVEHYVASRSKGVPTWVYIFGITVPLVIVALGSTFPLKTIESLPDISDDITATKNERQEKLEDDSAADIHGVEVTDRDIAHDDNITSVVPVDPVVAALYSNLEEANKLSEEQSFPSLALTEVVAADTTSKQQSTDSVSVKKEVDIEKALRLIEQEMGEARLSPHPSPLLENLSQREKGTVPTLIYTVHDYNPSTGGSSVVLNGDRLLEGQHSNGVLVKEILSDSVILSWDGIDFRLRALNSWVNL